MALASCGVTYPHHALAALPHHRAGDRRLDEAWLADAWSHDEAAVLVVAGNRVPTDARGAIEWIPSREAPAGTRVLLGEQRGRVWWAVLADRSMATGARSRWVDLRTILQSLADAAYAGPTGEAPLVFHAVGLAEWHLVTRYCPRCAADLVPRAAGHELACTGCGRPQFPRTDPAVIMLVTAGEPGTAEERCLLGHNPRWPEGRYSTLAGFCEPGESLEDAVRREVAEEAGIRVGQVSYFGNQPWPFPASLMLGFFGRAETTSIRVDPTEIEHAVWLTRRELWDQAAAGQVALPGRVSISRSLIEHWYGAELPGSW